MVKEFRASHKKIYDPIHGLISIDDAERELIDSPPFQRLHYIHQLGISYLVFPGASHSRFEHSLGSMEISTRIYNRLCKTVRPDLFNLVPRKGSAEYLYWQKVLRLASLCHDLGHMPFSVFTSGLDKEKEHAKFTISIIESGYLLPAWEEIKLSSFFQSRGGDLVGDVIKVALGEEVLQKIDPKKYSFSPWERILAKIINHSFFGSCKLDSLLRDSKSTGILYSLFDCDLLIEMLRILPKEKGGFEIGIDQDGLESCEALALAYHFIQKRVYQYHTVLAYNFHLNRFLTSAYNDLFSYTDVKSLLNYTDATIINDINIAANDPSHKGHLDAKKIIYRKDRFKAIPICGTISEKDLLKFKNKNDIADDQIAWEININKEKLNLSFPVVKHHLKICLAKDCSTFLSSVSSDLSDWVYISPEYEMLFLQYLENK